jgi:6-phosphogluconolactonase (cycloisomerase 2 family)
MRNSRTHERSRSFTNVRFHLRAVAPVLALVIGVWGCGGGGGQSGNNQPPPPVPTVTAISPNSAAAGGAAFTLTITGTNFVATSTVNFGGTAPATTFVSSAQLTAAIPAASIASTGSLGVTVTNPAPGGGGTSNSVSFTITSSSGNPVPVINYLSPGCAPPGSSQALAGGLAVGGQNFVGDSVVRWNGSDLPTTFNSSTQLTAQVPASDLAAAGSATVTAFNPAPGGGRSNSLTFFITSGGVDPQSIAVDPNGMFAYVEGGGCVDDGTVSMYTINPTTGALASIGPAVDSNGYGVYPGFVTVDPSGRFVYVTNSGNVYNYDSAADGTVAVYAINVTTGALTSSATIDGNCPGLCFPSSVVVHPSGKFAYVPDGNYSGSAASVSMYAINAATGALTSIGTIAAGSDPVSVAIDPAGKFAYAANSGSGDVSMYTINATTGALTSVGTIAAGSDPVSVALDPTGAFAYVANSGSNNVSMYNINATTGVLTSAGLIDAGTTPVSVAVDPAGTFAYVVNINSNDVSMYTIDAATGALTSTGTIAAGTNPTSVAVHPSGKFAYVTNSGSNNISIYSIDGASGTLTLIGTIGS